MRAEKGCTDRDRPLAAEATGGRELPHLGLGVEAIAGLDFDGGHALADQRIEPRQRAHGKVGLARLPRCRDGRDDATAGARDLFVACALEAQLEFMRAVAAIDEMGVAIDEARRNPAARAVDPFGRVRIHREVRLRASKGDVSVARCDQAVIDLAEIGTITPHRGEPGVVPDAIEALSHAIVPRLGMLDIYV